MTAEPAAWQNGYALPVLRSLAAPFKAATEGLRFGAFGVPNERTVAEALKQHRLQFAQGEAGGVAAAAIGRLLERGSKHKDFAQRDWKVQPGELLVGSLGCEPGAEQLAGELLTQMAGDAPAAWVEIYEENRELRAAVEALGFAWWTTKVAASSDLRGVYRRPAKPFPIDTAELAGLAELDPDFLSGSELELVREELAAFLSSGGAWAQHYSSYNKRKSWQAFALRGFQPDEPAFISKPAEMARSWREENPELLAAPCENTTAAAAFPRTLELLERIPGTVERLRFMRLTPGGELTRHADITNKDAGVTDGRLVRLHLPVLSPPECQFRSWSLRGEVATHHLAPGGLFYLDQRKPHAVQNPSDSERIHIVADVAAGSWHRDRIRKGHLRG